MAEYPREVTDPQAGETRPVSENARNRWFGEMSYAYLDGGFSKTAIGKVIRTRIEAGIEMNIHDASQWIEEFKLPGEAYDTQAILRQRKEMDFDPSAITAVSLRDPFKELDFFLQVMHAGHELRARLNLSSKEGAAESLFSQPEYQLLYQVLTSEDDGVPLYKRPNFSIEMLREAALAAIPNYAKENAMGHAKETTTHTDNEDATRFLINDLFNMTLTHETLREEPPQGRISDTVRDLRLMGEARRNYIHDTQKWLLRHATFPSDRLKHVWKDRGLALADGAADNAAAIENWQKDNGLKIALRQMEGTGKLQEEYGFTVSEVMNADNAVVRETLIAAMSAENTLEAMKKLREWAIVRGDEPKVLPADAAEVSLDDAESGKPREYTVEILADDDPRGFTIGEETGCCMTIHGASNSCIEAGYTLPNAGFLAVYPPNSTKVGAQSFWYVHPDHPDTLVLDNIEANAGRDMNKMAEVYRLGLRAYLEKHPELPIKKVTVGTGYTDIELGDAPHVEPVPRLNQRIYTDAHSQRLLLDITQQ